jgi:hypothetical protein
VPDFYLKSVDLCWNFLEGLPAILLGREVAELKKKLK